MRYFDKGWQMGYDWVKDLASKPVGHRLKFWPEDENGNVIYPLQPGFAEGKITGCSEFKVNFCWATEEDVQNNIVTKTK
jgi:hypothetical protein